MESSLLLTINQSDTAFLSDDIMAGISDPEIMMMSSHGIPQVLTPYSPEFMDKRKESLLMYYSEYSCLNEFSQWLNQMEEKIQEVSCSCHSNDMTGHEASTEDQKDGHQIKSSSKTLTVSCL